MFETQKSGNKTSSGEIGLNIKTLASPEMEQDQVSGGVSILCWHAAPVANVLWKVLKFIRYIDFFSWFCHKKHFTMTQEEVLILVDRDIY